MADPDRFDQETLYNLLPAVYRTRDALQGEPLRALIGIIAAEVAVLEEDLAQLYDDQFIETGAEWVVPYIGDLIGTRGLEDTFTQARAQVANTLAYRRRKGTAAVLEQLARDVTRWDARAVEFFQLLATTQHLHHLRPKNHTPDIRSRKDIDSQEAQHELQPLYWANTPFDTWPRSAEVRSISRGRNRGRYNIPNVGIFLWRLRPHAWTRVTAHQVDDRRFLFNPLGSNTRLFSLPQTESTITHLAEPVNVPHPISRRVLKAHLDSYYGINKSMAIFINGNLVDAADVVVCNLADDGPNWAHHLNDEYAIDPVLGRLALPLIGQVPDPDQVRVSFHYGFPADIGSGEYQRGVAGDADVDAPATVADGLAALGSGSGIIELDGGVYPEALAQLTLVPGQEVTLHAADEQRAYLRLAGDWIIDGGSGSSITLDGLLISGGSLIIRGQVETVTIRHCTLVPGIELDVTGTPQSAGPSLQIETAGVRLTIEESIIGRLLVHQDSPVQLHDTIVDALSPEGVAYAAEDGASAGGELTCLNCTVIGKVHTARFELASNAIFDSRVTPGDGWAGPVWADQRQAGCMRFSYVPLDSRVPRRFQCVPVREEDAGRVQPVFTTRRYNQPGYLQLGVHCPAEIAQGADDESEMGVYHDLYSPQRIRNLRLRLDEYLRFGLEAGIIFAT